MSFFRRIDDFMFDRVFQPATNRLARFTTPKKLSLFCISGGLVMTIARVYGEFEGGSLGSSDAFAGGISIAAASITYFATSRTPAVSTGRFRNPERLSAVGLAIRMMNVFLGTFSSLLSIATDGGFEMTTFVITNLCWLAFVYFAGCDDPPPAEEKKRSDARGLAFAGSRR